MKIDTITEFCRALRQNETETIADLAPRVDPNAKDRWGNTPLLTAAQYGDLSLVSVLVGRGAEVDQQKQYLTPITLAARRQAADIVAYLRNKGATLSVVTWVYLGDTGKVARELKRDPKNARLRDEAGTPLLHHAVEALQTDLVVLLLDHGAGVDETDPTGETALHRLADIRQAPQQLATELAKLLLARGADPNSRNWDDVTPLHQAVRARNLTVVELLLAGGANPNARDKIRGSTPLRRAVSATGAAGTAGTAALMLPLTRLLLEYGADPDACDKRGVQVRASARAPEIVALLEEHRREKRHGRAKGRTNGTAGRRPAEKHLHPKP